MPEKPMTEMESLQIIQRMITAAKQEQRDNGAGWILWGWLLFAACFFSVINLHTEWFSQYFFWNIFGVCTLILLTASFFKNRFRPSAAKVRTYTSDLFQQLNLGFTITLMLHIISINRGVDPIMGFALLSSLYGFWIMIYATALSFRPSYWGAFATWACALGGLFVTTYEQAMILHGIGVFAGYIVPGHIAMKEFKNIQKAG